MKSSNLLDLPLTQIILLYIETALTKLVAWVVRNSGIWDTQERETLWKGNWNGANKKSLHNFMEGLWSALVKANYPNFCGGDTNLGCFFPWKS